VSVRWDSRECPGLTTEAELSCPSTRRALTAGALVLAVIAPTAEPVEHAAEAGSPAQPVPPAVAQASGFAFDAVFMERPPAGLRSSRSAPRRAAGLRPASPLSKAIIRRAARRSADRSVERELDKAFTVRRTHLSRSIAHRRSVSRNLRAVDVSGGMAAVLAFAQAQIGKNYVTGGDGPNGFDCSGFTQRAYAHAGLRLPHSSGAQAARARTISRSRARPGDLVVGPGHVGVYMGGGMMIDAGNHRVGVVYRHLYAGLHIERF
jgi:cell wall-associated NlpC family hydrolase